MRERIAPLDTAERRSTYLRGDFPRSDAVQNLDRRYRWDLFYAARCQVVLGVNNGILGAHIETALRSIVPELKTTKKAGTK